MATDKDIGKISKGEYQGTITDIIVGIKEYNGRVGVDIREFTTSEAYTGPTKKGLRIPAEKFEEFQRMISLIKPEDLKTDTPKQESLPTESPEKESSATESEEEASGVTEDGFM